MDRCIFLWHLTAMGKGMRVAAWQSAPLLQHSRPAAPCAGNARHLQTLMNVAATLGRQMTPLPAAASVTVVHHHQQQQSGGSSSAQASGSSGAVVQTVNDFLLSSGLDNLNLFKLVR